MTIFSQISRRRGRDLNRVPPEYYTSLERHHCTSHFGKPVLVYIASAVALIFNVVRAIRLRKAAAALVEI
jgi:hypothetical protein